MNAYQNGQATRQAAIAASHTVANVATSAAHVAKDAALSTACTLKDFFKGVFTTPAPARAPRAPRTAKAPVTTKRARRS